LNPKFVQRQPSDVTNFGFRTLEYSEIKLGRDTDQLDLEDTQNL